MKFLAEKEDTAALRKALIKTLNEAQKPKQNGNNPYTKKNYATLTDANDAVKEVAAKNGLGITQDATNSEDGNSIIITTYLIHEAGIIEFDPLKLPIAKNDPQGYGSTITYARRYALTANLNLNVEDDDGQAGSAPYQNNQRRNNNNNWQGNNNRRQQQAPQKPKKADKKDIDSLRELINIYAELEEQSNVALMNSIIAKGGVKSLEDCPAPLVEQYIKILSSKIDTKTKEQAEKGTK